MTTKRSTFPCPMVKRAFDGYRSPVSNEYIPSRKEREQDLVRHDCMPAQDIVKNPRINHPGNSTGKGPRHE